MNLKENLAEYILSLDWSFEGREIVDLIKQCLRMQATRINEVALGKSKFGGQPDLSPTLPWPTLNQKPLAFLGQINFQDLAISELVPLQFSNKLISFFISPYQEDYRDVDGVMHCSIISDINSQVKLERKDIPTELSHSYNFPERALSFVPSVCLPSYQHHAIENLKFTDNDAMLYSDEVLDHLNELANLNYVSGHMLFGYSDAIQGDSKRHWAAKQLLNEAGKEHYKQKAIEQKFEQLIQFDLSQDFNSAISDGCAYFGYVMNESGITEIQCSLQNT